jgi:hypothetical protein
MLLLPSKVWAIMTYSEAKIDNFTYFVSVPSLVHEQVYKIQLVVETCVGSFLLHVASIDSVIINLFNYIFFFQLCAMYEYIHF